MPAAACTCSCSETVPLWVQVYLSRFKVTLHNLAWYDDVHTLYIVQLLGHTRLHFD